MGQICSFFQYICCCCCRPDSKVQESGHFKVLEQQQSTIQGLIPENQLTEEFKFPSNEFQTFEDILKYKGYSSDLSDVIGKGGFAVVYKVIRLIDQKVVAMKQIFLKGKDEERDKKKFENLKNEIFVISHIRHKNIVDLLDHFIINNNCYLVMSFANGGNLNEEVLNTNGLPEDKAKKYFKQIARAVEHLHRHIPPIAHRDLKLPNILIYIENNEKILKVTDFGFSNVLFGKTNGKSSRAVTGEGTLAYMSPQMIKLVLYEETRDKKNLLKTIPGSIKTVDKIKADIWSLGVCLYVMISGGPLPFDLPEHYNKQSAKEDQLFKTVELQYELKRRPLLDKNPSSSLINLLDKTLEPSTKYRIDIIKILEHKWLSGVPDMIPLD